MKSTRGCLGCQAYLLGVDVITGVVILEAFHMRIEQKKYFSSSSSVNNTCGRDCSLSTNKYRGYASVMLTAELQSG